MKSNSSSNSSSSSSNEGSNWLGFSLSPNTISNCFDVGEQHIGSDGFLSSSPSPLAVMPLKSDGSLCIMDALTRSTQEPKLENFLGGDNTTMALSLDSLYYHHHNQQQQQEAAFSLLRQQQGLYQQAVPLNQHCQVANNHHYYFHQSHNFHYSNGNGDDNGDGNGNGYGNLQPLSLSMSPTSQSSCVTTAQQISPPSSGLELVAVETTKKRGISKVNGGKQTVHRKSIDTFGQRTSQYRGVTKHRWTGRYEAHLWDNSCKKEGQTRKGRQVYLGGYDMEEKAARAYDLAALKYWGLSTHTNFPIENYKLEVEEMKNMTRQEYVAHLRRKSSGFSRGASMYRGVTRHHQHGRWQARIGRVAGNKDLYLGTFSTQEEAAEAYDVAAIKFRGVNAVTNFDISRYDVEKIMASNTLLAGEHAKRNKLELAEVQESDSISTSADNGSGNVSEWKMMLYHNSLNSLVALEDAGQTQPEPIKLGAAHFSNASSLVTSLESSREGSPDHGSGNRNGEDDGLKLVGPDWFASAQLRPNAIPVAHSLPVFAAWGDIA